MGAPSFTHCSPEWRASVEFGLVVFVVWSLLKCCLLLGLVAASLLCCSFAVVAAAAALFAAAFAVRCVCGR